MKSCSEVATEEACERLLGEAVERLAALGGEALGEGEVLNAARFRRAGEPSAKCSHILVVELVSRPKIVHDAAYEILADALGAHSRSPWRTGIKSHERRSSSTR